MDFRYLKAFLLTAKHSSFSKAAKELNIAQSAVSRQIKLLEEELGEDLIIRSPKKVILTPKGEQLFQTASSFSLKINDIFKKDSDYPIRIGVLHGLLESWLSQILIKFYGKYNRNVFVNIGDPGELKEQLAQGKLDLVFSTENIQTDIISGRKLFKENLVLISKNEVDLKKLHQYRWIVYSTDDNIYNLTKKRSEHITCVESITTIVNLVRNGVGIAVVPDHVLKKNDKLSIYPVKQSKEPEVYMLTHNYQTLPSYLKEFVTLLE